jgi:hypothetical protein
VSKISWLGREVKFINYNALYFVKLTPYSMEQSCSLEANG